MEYKCTICGCREEVTTRRASCVCGGLWTLTYRAEFDLNRIDNTQWCMLRYHAFIPVDKTIWTSISLGEGMTPIIAFNDNVLLKMDYLMPTLSFKDRGASVLIAHCKSIGVNHVVQDSSGNAGNSIAAYCAKADIQCEIFVPEGTSSKKIEMIRSHGATCTVVPGDRDHCADFCRKQVKNRGVYYANHVYNPFFYEGTKSYIYEVFEQLGRIPKALILPVGNGTLFLGVLKGLEELLEAKLISYMPLILAVQSDKCCPLYKAVEQLKEKPCETPIEQTLAEGIAIGRPMRGEEILRLAYKYSIKFITAPEDEIVEAQSELAKRGVFCEPTTAANYAAYRAYCREYGMLNDCLITMCGAGLKGM